VTVTVRLTDEAERDIRDAALWYERQRLGLGHEFLDQLLLTRDRIAANPEAYQPVHGVIRRAPMRRFPFSVMYMVLDSEVNILAVMHFSRDPARWKSR
jgi:plasmid stabilization system protein ParE